ncbi:MAG: hypothetical protein ABL921_34665 [Pirellula sp.]
MKFTLRQLFFATVLFSLFCSLAMYLTTSYRERLAIRTELQTFGINGVGFGPQNTIRSIWSHGPIQEQFLVKCKRLEVADFKENAHAAQSIEILAKMDEVKTLILSLSDVSDTEIARLKSIRGLKHLWLTNTRVTDACIDHLGEIEDLETIILGGTSITPQGIERLRSMMPQLRIR